MSQETLRLDIIADSAKAKSELDVLGKALTKLEKNVQAFGGGIKTFVKPEIFKPLTDSVNDTVKGTDKLVKGSNQAANALTNLGRVAQDAPFGFIGIQNNLNPLLESFQRLKAETGSSASAFKSLAGSLIGPAGLGLALSLGSAALLMFGDKLFGTKKQTEDTKKASQEYTRQLQEQSRAATDAVTKVAALVSAGLSEEATLKQRKEILKQLNKESSAYFGNLRIEKGEIAGLIEAYGMYAQNIFKVAKAKGAAQQVEKLSKELLSSTTNLKGLTDELTNLNLANSLIGGPKQVEKNLNEIDGILKKVLFSQEDIKRVSDLTGISEANVNDLLKRRSVERTKELRLTAQILDLSKFTNQETLSSLAVTKEKAEKEFDILKYRQEMDGLFKESLLGTPEVFAPKEKAAKMTDSSLPTSAVEIDNMITNLRLANMAKIRKQKEDDLKYEEEMALAMTNVAMSAFTSLGNAMLQGQDLGEALGNVFKKLIVDLTQMVARALIFKAIMTALSGGASEAGDVISGGSGAASAFNGMKLPAKGGKSSGGGGIFGILKGLLGFADGGIASGPKSGYPVMLHGTEAVLNPKQFKNLTSNMMNLGAARGGGMMNVQVEGILRGQDIVLQRTRAERALGLLRG